MLSVSDIVIHNCKGYIPNITFIVIVYSYHKIFAVISLLYNILVADFILNSLYLLIPYSYHALPLFPLPVCNHYLFSISVSLLLFFFYSLDSTYK